MEKQKEECKNQQQNKGYYNYANIFIDCIKNKLHTTIKHRKLNANE